MSISEIIGEYSIIGSNQDQSSTEYTGILYLKLNEVLKVEAEWTINGDQKQYGLGFFKNNILVINFHYLGDDDKKYKGVVVYKVLTKDILEGFWSEKHGDQNYLGEERCFRIKNSISKC